jgi:predicted RNase H-like HicB family nuclease
MVTELKKKVDYYVGLPYTMTIEYCEDQGGYYLASYTELPDLIMTGPTPEEAVKELLVEKPEWFETCLKLGIEIPMPVQNKKYRGKIAPRVAVNACRRHPHR